MNTQTIRIAQKIVIATMIVGMASVVWFLLQPSLRTGERINPGLSAPVSTSDFGALAYICSKARIAVPEEMVTTMTGGHARTLADECLSKVEQQEKGAYSQAPEILSPSSRQ